MIFLERMFDGYYVQRAAISYDGNQIVSVNDASEDESTGMAPRFPSGVYPDAVAYDANGNITRDDTRAITSVTYHPFYNLPKQVNFADGSFLQWDYRPDGKKVKSTASEKYIRVTVTVNSKGDTIVRKGTMYNTDSRKYIISVRYGEYGSRQDCPTKRRRCVNFWGLTHLLGFYTPLEVLSGFHHLAIRRCGQSCRLQGRHRALHAKGDLVC